MKTIIIVSILIIVSVLSSGWAISEEFLEKIHSGFHDKSSVIEEYLKKTDHIDDLRLIQDEWLLLDADSCYNYFAELKEANPANRKYHYLWVRAIEDSQTQLDEARKLVKSYPDFRYAYLLIAYPYNNGLFYRSGSVDIEIDSLENQLQSDKVLLEQWLDYFPDDEEALFTLYVLSMWEKNYEKAESILIMTANSKPYWVNYDLIVEFSRETGRLDAFRKLFPIMLHGGVVDNVISVADSSFLYTDYYTYLLKDLHKWDEIEKFIKNNPSIANQANILKIRISLYLHREKYDEAVGLLADLFDKGGVTYKAMVNNKEWQALRESSQWTLLEERAKIQWDNTKEQRRVSALAQKQYLPAPDWQLHDIHDNIITLKQTVNKPLVLVFWSLQSEESLNTLQQVNKLSETDIGRKINAYAVNVFDHNKTMVKSFMTVNNISLKLLFGNEQLLQDYQIPRFPFVAVIDKNEALRYTEVGYNEDFDEKLAFWLEDLITSP